MDKWLVFSVVAVLGLAVIWFIVRRCWPNKVKPELSAGKDTKQETAEAPVEIVPYREPTVNKVSSCTISVQPTIAAANPYFKVRRDMKSLLFELSKEVSLHQQRSIRNKLTNELTIKATHIHWVNSNELLVVRPHQKRKDSSWQAQTISAVQSCLKREFPWWEIDLVSNGIQKQ